MPSPHPSARIAVDRLVAAETKRRRAPALERIEPHAPLKDQALDTLSAVREQIDELTEIAGRLARVALDAGSSWHHVGERLRMSPADTRSAFDQP